MGKTKISNRLKQLMAERNMKQIDVLEMCKPVCEKYNVKLGKSALSQYINGAVAPGMDKILVFCEAFGVNQAWLMGYDVYEINKSQQEAMELAEIILKLSPEKVKAVKDFIEFQQSQ